MKDERQSGKKRLVVKGGKVVEQKPRQDKYNPPPNKEPSPYIGDINQDAIDADFLAFVEDIQQTSQNLKPIMDTLYSMMQEDMKAGVQFLHPVVTEYLISLKTAHKDIKNQEEIMMVVLSSILADLFNEYGVQAKKSLARKRGLDTSGRPS